MSPSSTRSLHGELSDPELRLYLAGYLRRRLPAADADDALQAVYCAALEARRRPDDAIELRRWMTGIARRKIAASYAHTTAEQLGDPPEQSVPPAPVEELSLLRWAEREAAASQVEHVDETLEWMARESEGEKLEAIAAEAALPPTRVRQRVFRLRRFMRARWALELSAALLAIAIAWWLWSRREAEMAKPLITPLSMPSTVASPPVEPPKEAISPPTTPSIVAPPTPSVSAPPTPSVTAAPKILYTTPYKTPGPQKPKGAKKGTPTTGTAF